MTFVPTPLPGAFVVEPHRFEDERGYFAEAWNPAQARAHGIDEPFVRSNVSFNRYKGTLRGMHAQAGEAAEAKLVRCFRGAVWDVIVDIRPNSPTYCQWFGVELAAGSQRMLYVPKGFLHGFQTLTDEAEVYYQCSNVYNPQAEIGARFDDPAFAIQWPEPVEKILSDKDRGWPPFQR